MLNVISILAFVFPGSFYSFNSVWYAFNQSHILSLRNKNLLSCSIIIIFVIKLVQNEFHIGSPTSLIGVHICSLISCMIRLSSTSTHLIWFMNTYNNVQMLTSFTDINPKPRSFREFWFFIFHIKEEIFNYVIPETWWWSGSRTTKLRCWSGLESLQI